MPRKNQPGCPCGCGGTSGCGCWGCVGQPFPLTDLTLTIDPPFLDDPSVNNITLSFNGDPLLPGWSGCVWSDAYRCYIGWDLGCRSLSFIFYDIFRGNRTTIPCEPGHQSTGSGMDFFGPVTYQASPFKVTFEWIDLLGEFLNTFTITGPSPVPPIKDTCVSICVLSCARKIVGATVTITDRTGATVATGKTGASGCVTLDIGKAGTYTITIVAAGYSTLIVPNVALKCGRYSYNVSRGVVCCGAFSIPEKLTLTDGEGTLDFLYDPNYFYPLWTGGHPVQRTSCTVTTPNNICLVSPPSQGPVRVCYQMICHAGQTPTFAVQRSWSWVYEQGTLTPIYYQDPSGFAPGGFCITSPPAICGNPLTDTASFAADPMSQSPFVLTGSPEASAANQTGDPVGGGVTISA